MKKLLVLTLTLVLTISFGYVTLASTIGIGATEGFQVEVGTVVDPSDYTDDIDITAYYGLNEKTQFSLSYATDCKDISFGARYAFAKNMAVTLDFLMPDAEDADDEVTVGFRYKANINDALALVGVLEYTNTDPDATIVAKAQGEYGFTDQVVGTLQYKYTKIDEYDTYNIILGIETYPTEQLCIYLDFDMPDDEENDENNAYLGVCYSF